MIGRALLLIGSPRGDRSNSIQIGSYLTDRLQEKGVEIEKLLIIRLLGTDEGQRQLLTAVDAADLIVLAFPLYVDCLPSQTIRAMELIQEHRKANQKKQKLMAIVNSGFPEPHQNQIAADICRKFAAEAGFEWMGCARIGIGMAVRARPLEETKKLTGKLMKGLDQAAELLADGKPLTPQVESKLYLSLMSPLMVMFMRARFNTIWDNMASPYALERMYDRPYNQ